VLKDYLIDYLKYNLKVNTIRLNNELGKGDP